MDCGNPIQGSVPSLPEEDGQAVYEEEHPATAAGCSSLGEELVPKVKRRGDCRVNPVRRPPS